MKYIILLLIAPFISFGQALQGLWESNEDQVFSQIIATENYLVFTKYKQGEFLETWGGKYNLSNTEEIFIEFDFHTSNIEVISSIQSYNIKLKKKSFELLDIKYSKANEIKSPLNGLWQISARANKDGEMVEMKQGSRKTYKILYDGAFQWIAFDNGSREFSGTGGGTFSLKKEAYEETITFFSRDNSRVGAKLNFNAKVNGDIWNHSGKSSTGANIAEQWKLKFKD